MDSWKTKLLDKFRRKEYRESYLDSFINDTITAQLHNLRKDKQWTQAELARRAGMKQPRVALMESSDYDNYSISTLKRLAHAFDVALIVKFSPFSELAAFSSSFSSKDVHVPDYESDIRTIERPEVSVELPRIAQEADWNASSRSFGNLPERGSTQKWN